MEPNALDGVEDLDGEVLYPAGGDRRAPGGAYARFRALPVADIEAALDAILDAHVAIDPPRRYATVAELAAAWRSATA